MDLVSIIIPNFNRADLISETLDSIINQTYTNWECLIIDDGSTDHSLEVIREYENRDKRFKLFVRPNDSPKGANACRNIGIEKAISDYVIFFDSDDLMTNDHIEQKLIAIKTGDYDFIISRTKYFNNPNNINPINYRELDKLAITVDNFVSKKINWLTLDPIIKSSIIKQLRFTEKNQSAEEYNFFVKLLILTNKAVAIENILTLRRYHEGSYQVNLNNDHKIAENKFNYFYDTYLETNKLGISKILSEYLLSQSLEVFYKNKKFLSRKKMTLYCEIIKHFGIIKGLNKIRIIEFQS